MKLRHNFYLAGVLLLIVTGCAGFRGGWMSVAYIGAMPPELGQDAEVDSELRERPLRPVPGLELKISMDNQLRTYDTQVYFALPLGLDPRRVYPKNNRTGITRVFVTATPEDVGFVFRASEAVLAIGEQRFAALAGYEFGLWGKDGERVKDGGTWDHRPVGKELALTEPGRSYYLSIDFATPVPSPESEDISLDLSRALVSDRHPPVPLIRFAPMRWKEGYT
ncbi:MAG TPA: hypothetical protein ENO16_03065 [Chromatiales bacterium]|nr:hypothetical protein [Chromatiales bacterium]